MTPNFDLSTGKYKVLQFPSGEVQVQLTKQPEALGDVLITGSILSSDHTMELLQLVEALRFEGVVFIDFLMPYCAYSRQDRRCNEGESFSLKIFAQLINSCDFRSVLTYDNHSDVATALIDNCTNIPVKDILYRRPEVNIRQYDYFVSPDAGANKKVFDCSKQFNISMIRADKTRDVKTGNIIETLVFATANELKNKTVLIIDDIGQGGRTFEELAKAMKAIEPSCIIHLYVTHGFFSHQFGISYMQSAGISKFITTDSVYNRSSEIDQMLTTVIKL